MGRVVVKVKGTVGDGDRLTSTERVVEAAVADIGNHVTRETGNWLTVEHTFPTKPTTKSVIAVVVVSSQTELEALVQRHWHVVQEENFARMAFVQTGQTRDGVDHVKHVNACRVNVAASPACEQAVGRAFTQPLDSVLLVLKAHVNVVGDGWSDVVVHHTRQGCRSIRVDAQLERVGRIFQEIIAQAIRLRAQSVDADSGVCSRTFCCGDVTNRERL